MNLAAVRLNLTLAEQRIVGWQSLHRSDDLGAVMRVAAFLLKNLQVMGHGRIYAGMNHGRHLLVLHALREALAERASLIVQVPIEGFGEVQAIGYVEAKRVDVADEQQQRRELLAARDNAEFGRLLDRVRCVAASIGETDDLRLRACA